MDCDSLSLINYLYDLYAKNYGYMIISIINDKRI